MSGAVAQGAKARGAAALFKQPTKMFCFSGPFPMFFAGVFSPLDSRFSAIKTILAGNSQPSQSGSMHALIDGRELEITQSYSDPR